jgi:hypothetical protein
MSNAERHASRKNPVGVAIREKFSDAKWRTAAAIARTLEMPLDDVSHTLELMAKRGGSAKNYKCERRRRATAFEFRIFSQKRTVGVDELTERLGPLVERLKEQGRRNAATIAISAIAEIASLLESLLTEWSQ